MSLQAGCHGEKERLESGFNSQDPIYLMVFLHMSLFS